MARRSRLVGRPAPAPVRPPARLRLPARAGGGAQILVERARRLRRAAPLRKARTLSTRTVRSSATVTTSPARTVRLGGIDALAVEAHMAGGRERGGGAAGAHHPRVPQPFVDALPVQRSV